MKPDDEELPLTRKEKARQVIRAMKVALGKKPPPPRLQASILDVMFRDIVVKMRALPDPSVGKPAGGPWTRLQFKNGTVVVRRVFTGYSTTMIVGTGRADKIIPATSRYPERHLTQLYRNARNIYKQSAAVKLFEKELETIISSYGLKDLPTFEMDILVEERRSGHPSAYADMVTEDYYHWRRWLRDYAAARHGRMGK
jgi:hypothetical protein